MCGDSARRRSKCEKSERRWQRNVENKCMRPLRKNEREANEQALSEFASSGSRQCLREISDIFSSSGMARLSMIASAISCGIRMAATVEKYEFNETMRNTVEGTCHWLPASAIEGLLDGQAHHTNFEWPPRPPRAFSGDALRRQDAGREGAGRERWTRGRGVGAKGQEERKGKKQEYDTRTRGRNHADLVHGRAATNVWKWGAEAGGEESPGAGAATAEDDVRLRKPVSTPKSLNAATGPKRQKLESQNPRCPHETPARRRGKAKRGAGERAALHRKNGTGQGRSGEGVGDKEDWMKGAGRGGSPRRRRGWRMGRRWRWDVNARMWR
ncbi:hypothetical protein C8J57DRAFT_1232638 [Mycena rebaudengoi]|nr:hypothetical protein C8J57DRAFT_1232638 [Mycena rebaudengoi]